MYRSLAGMRHFAHRAIISSALSPNMRLMLWRAAKTGSMAVRLLVCWRTSLHFMPWRASVDDGVWFDADDEPVSPDEDMAAAMVVMLPVMRACSVAAVLAQLVG